MQSPLGCTKKDLLSLVSFLVWSIWKSRYDAVFKSVDLSPNQTISTSTRHWLEFKNANSCALKPILSNPACLIDPTCLSWTPPPEPLVKINVDGAWDNSSSFSGSGVIIRDSLSNFIAGSSTNHKVSSVIEAEAFSLVDGIQLAVQLNQDNVILESDSLELISSLALLSNISWRWILRQANRVADAAAKLAKSRLSTDVWVNRPPTCLIDVLTSDGLPCPH
ncbi:hypothetical protein M0R45_002307 [Rubus argutus]|uniref:RNase H type-1 domain-containing protein n=1 Tax=Rubus argutus TaxID=59490 RepID=A0AAW1VC11_RUBAR